jgi:hypothetical protein
MTESCGKPAVCDGFSGPGLTASFMPPAYIRSLRGSQGAVPNPLSKTLMQGSETGQKQPQNANDHEQRARVHPAQPSYSVVVPAPEL